VLLITGEWKAIDIGPCFLSCWIRGLWKAMESCWHKALFLCCTDECFPLESCNWVEKYVVKSELQIVFSFKLYSFFLFIGGHMELINTLCWMRWIMNNGFYIMVILMGFEGLILQLNIPFHFEVSWQIKLSSTYIISLGGRPLGVEVQWRF